MDEVEITNAGESIVGTKFRPLVPSSEATFQRMQFTAEYEAEREAVLTYLADAED